MLLEQLKAQKSQIIMLAEPCGISELRIFGSVVRGEETPDSDIDLLVHIEPTRSMFDLLRFKREATDLLGRECDVVSDRGLNPLLRDRILTEARPL